MGSSWRGGFRVTGFVLWTAVAAQAGRIEWVPVGATGPHTIAGNEITLNSTSGMLVTLELRISNWDPDHDMNPGLGAYQATVDSAGYHNASGVSLAPLTTPSAAAGAFIIASRCTVNQQISQNGAACGFGLPQCPQGEFCVPNPDYILSCCNPILVLAVVTLNYEYGGVSSTGGSKADDGLSYYAGTLILEVPSGARGSYTIGLFNNPNNDFTFLLDAGGNPIPVTQLVPATIKIACSSAAMCSDGNPCTQDRCSGGTCSWNPLPAGTACSDGLLCTTSETCNASGVCQPGGTLCTGLPAATCDESLGCVGPGNFNGDEALDLADWMDFAVCLDGPGAATAPGCTPARMDGDADADLRDAALFFRFFTGP